MRIFFRVYIDYVGSHHFAGSQVTYFFQAFTLGERAELFEKIGPMINLFYFMMGKISNVLLFHHRVDVPL